jgi:hypothetical protein
MFLFEKGTAATADEPAVRLNQPARPVTTWLAVLAVAIPSVVGGNFLGAYLQNRGWERQRAIEIAANQAVAAENALAGLNDHLDQRWLAMDRLYRLNGREDQKVDGVDRDDLVARFYEIDARWNSARNGLEGAMQFDVDAPFGVAVNDPIVEVAKLDCAADPLADAKSISEQPSARVLLEISDHCMFDLKNELDAIVADNEATGDWKGLDTRHARLDYVYRVNNALRCLIAERALAMRMAYSPPSSGVFGGAAKPYAFPPVRSSDCGLPDRADVQPAVVSLAP